MKIEKVNLEFSRAPVPRLLETALAVDRHLYGKPDFAEPPVTRPVLTAARKALEEAQGAMAQGGTATTAARDQVQEVLVTRLRILAAYVQTVSAGDLAKLLSSGFTANSKNRTRVPLATPEQVKVRAGIAGQLLIAVKRVVNARTMDVQLARVAADGTPGPWFGGGQFTNSRRMAVDGLEPGALYVIRLRAIGGLTGSSGWSNPVIARCL